MVSGIGIMVSGIGHPWSPALAENSDEPCLCPLRVAVLSGLLASDFLFFFSLSLLVEAIDTNFL